MNVLVRASGTNLASAKRSSAERRGVHAWHPYYAGYSERFVESALAYLNCRPGHIVLDPWGGSGTTGIVAARNGVDSICLDINPVMATFSAGKARAVLSLEPEVAAWLNAPRPADHDGEQDPLTRIFSPATALALRRWIQSAPRGNEVRRLPDAFRVGEPATLDALHSFCLSVIFVTLRRLSGARKLQNPTWLRTVSGTVEISPQDLEAQIAINARHMLSDLASFYALSTSQGDVSVATGDARALPLRDESIDAVITSPPYLTRIDYAVSTRPELLMFGDEVFLEEIRHRTMGAPVITKVDRVQKTEWGPICNDVLEAIKAHSTKAAASYYWKNIIQYFMDMDAALSELRRTLKPGGSALIVVQSSYFKEVEIPLGEIYVQAASAIGFEAKIASREAIKTHMAHVNTASNAYKRNKVYFEDVVHIRRPLNAAAGDT